MYAFLITLHSHVLAADPTPADKDVKAGWPAFFIFLGLAVAVGLLGWSLVRQLNKTKRNADAGVFGTPDEGPTGPAAG
ncbi:hypothetical protein [Nocardioides marmorisolisilvae]|uniref:Uncharacterized protein n=1 Tax=Nocardioides marmorisolisilvae TaxID=1542737 RepID=A0A3N0DZ53_9ACTN|nr:hypothetical protein [Nocardioides marmorisolisilvae]RNL80888.1 hypothetical protein EFL95_00415 [Nocardioides marmorisolisilvae]